MVLLMIVSFVTSIFDVLDVHELCLNNGQTIFSTSNPDADNDYDGLGDDGFQFTTVQTFILPDNVAVCEMKRIVDPHLSDIFKFTFFYNFIPSLSSQPPIA